VNSGSLLKVTHLQNGARPLLAEREAKPYTLLKKSSDAAFFCAHTGTSMYPTLSEHDLLEIEPYGLQPIRVGDVVFFLSPDGGRPAIHRVASVTSHGIRTKGDNNSSVDPWIIHRADVIGRVVRATQGEKRRFIYRGIAGRFWSFGARWFTVAARGFSLFYHLLAQSGLLRRFVPLHKWMRIVALRRKNGRAFKLLLGNWMIGNYQSGMNYWQIRRPFRLFVDVESLPK
jgi:signal peptidase I